MNTFNDDRRNESDELSAMLNDLPEVDPPSSLVGNVMSTIAQSTKTSAAQPRINFNKRGDTMAKKVLWIVAAAAAVALVVMRVGGYPPVNEGTEATIGAAQRYQAPQITAADVKVEHQQLQAFLQSDVFRKLAADKAAQKALKNEDFQKALAEPSVRAALSAPGVAEAIYLVKADVAFQAGKLDIAKLDIAKLDVAKLDAGPRALLQSALASSPALVTALSAPGVAEAVSHSSLGVFLANSNNAFYLAQPQVMNVFFNLAPGVALDAATGAAATGVAAGAAAQ
jgi:hypothetical protein